VAMKGRNLPDTTLSRSIIITMKPRRANDPKEHAADFNHLDNETFARLRSQLMRFATDNAEALTKATPEVPPAFHNRRRANWVPLLAIAEAGGGEWKTAAWKAARAIEAVADTFDPSIGVELLRAIKAAFEARGTDRVTSAGLITDLTADETAPWATYNKGKPISQRQVATLLKPYGIRPKSIRLDSDETPKGYMLGWFTDAFDRLCTPSSVPTLDFIRHTATDLFSKDFSQFSSATDISLVADKNDEKFNDINTCGSVADEKGGVGEKGHIRTARSRSDDLTYRGPVVAVPELPPDPLDEHGAPRAAYTHVCVQCRRNPPDGNERHVAYGDERIWLHAECERFFIQAKMEEQGIPW